MLRTTRGARVQDASPEWTGNEDSEAQLAGRLGHLQLAEENDEEESDEDDTPPFVEVFCHGSARGNGQPGATGAYSCVFPAYPHLNSVVPVGAEVRPPPTNQRMAYKAAIHAIEIVNAEFTTQPVSLRIVTNNKVMNKSMSELIEVWVKNQWRRTHTNARVRNRDLIETVLMRLRPGQGVAWLHYDTDFFGADKERARISHDQAARAAKRAAPTRP